MGKNFKLKSWQFIAMPVAVQSYQKTVRLRLVCSKLHGRQ